MRIHKTLGDFGRGFLRIHETSGEDLQGLVRLWERFATLLEMICEDS